MATKPKTQNTEVAVAAAAAFAMTSEVPDYIKQDAARGSEEVSAKDMVLPRLEIVQSQSPIKDTNEEAREGMLFNSVTQELYGNEVYFIPVYFRTEYLIWKDQDEGGGFFGAFPTKAEAEARLEEIYEEEPSLRGQTKKGSPIVEIVDTPVHYGMLIDPQTGKTEQIVVSMPKSKAKVSRKWNATVQIVGGDRFSRVYKISTYTDENKQGQKFKNYVVQPAGFCPKAAYLQAEALYEVLKTQQVRAAHDTVVENDGEGGEGGEAERGEI